MRRPTLMCMFVVPVLMAQAPDPWELVVARQRLILGGRGAFIFLARPGEFLGPWGQSGDLAKLRISQEFLVGQFNAPESKALWVRQGWPDPEAHWVLLGPNGDIAAQGTSAPTAERLTQAMQDTGWRSRAEKRDIFFRQNPENGEAWREFANEATQLGSLGQNTDGPKPSATSAVGAPSLPPLTPEQDQARWGDLDRALRGLMSVEGWEDHLPDGLGDPASARAELQRSALLRPTLAKLRLGLESALHARPSEDRYWEAWSQVAELESGVSPEALLSSLDSPPHQTWPPAAAADSLAAAYRRVQDWTGLERMASGVIAGAKVPDATWDGNARALRLATLLERLPNPEWEALAV